MTTRPKDVLVPGVIVLLMFAGWIKASPVLAWSPVDLTLLAVVALAILTLGKLLATGLRLEKAVVPLLLLWLAFAVPALVAPASAYGDEKMLLMFGVAMLASFGAALLVGDQPERIWWLVRWSALGALGTAALLRIAPSTADLYGRYALEGGNTIGIGRSAGVGLVAIWLLMRAGRLKWRYGLPAVVVFVAVVFGSGSRGPLFAAGLAIATVALVQPAARRLRELAFIAVGGALLAAWALNVSSDLAVSRILATFSDDRGSSIDLRIILLERSLSLASSTPQGLGWGGLAPHLQPAAPYPHNILVEVFAEAGWLPGMVFVAVVVIALLRAFRSGEAGVAVGGLLVFWIANALVSGDINDNRALFATLGVALAVTASPDDRGDPAFRRRRHERRTTRQTHPRSLAESHSQRVRVGWGLRTHTGPCAPRSAG